MNNKRNSIYIFLLSASLLGLLTTRGSGASPEDTPNAVLVVHHPKAVQGKLLIHIFSPSDETPKKPSRTVSSPFGNNGVTRVYVSLYPGRYGFIAAIDENANGIIDHGLIFPKEALAFSGGFRLSLFSGLPSFDKLAVDVGKAAAMPVELRFNDVN